MNMKGQVKRSMKVLRRADGEAMIPVEVLRHAAGIVFMTQIKGAYLFSGTLGAGIFMKRLAEDKWSPPASIGMASVGAGFSIGAQKMDIIIVLNDSAAVKAFASHGHLQLGGDYSIAAGPVGRNVKVGVGVSRRGFSGMFSYSMSQGLYIGVSLEGSVLVTRSWDDYSFYKTKAHLPTILAGDVEVPEAKNKARNVAMLHLMLCNMAQGRSYDHGIGNIGQPEEMRKLDKEDLGPMDEAQLAADYYRQQEALQRQFKQQHQGQQQQQQQQQPGADQVARFAGQPNAPAGNLKLQRHQSSGALSEVEVAGHGKNLLVGALEATSSAQNLLDFNDLALQDRAAPAGTPARAPSSTVFINAEPFTSGDRKNYPPLQHGSQRILATQDHIVDESDPAMAAHNIISLRRGDPAFLLDGTLEGGLPQPYHDYVSVQRLADQRVGKVSRFCLARATAP